ncbi:MAG: capsule biosynthesis protein CapK [Betaproteobacteria bacterium HGW-Betaproteobacteria-21]|nr:MAG: capsule biosynthesis protein CapK [Betaproteobacteria bacterium HGW-Betaproteobacteria-21]
MKISYTRIGSSILFPIHERLKGHDTVAILHDIERSQWLASDRLRERQVQLLQEFLVTVSTSVPFFREIFRSRQLSPADFKALADLSLLPIIDKTCIRRNLAEWTAHDAHHLELHSTSGSSGEPLRFMLGRHRISFDIAAKWRAMRWWDVDIGDREMVLWGSAFETGSQNKLRKLRDQLLRSRLVPARDLNHVRMEQIITEMRAFRPKVLFGYPSALARIAFHTRDQHISMDDLGIKVAFCTSEVLRPEWREVISTTFGCGVANEYGARDAGFIARECPHGGMHITAEELIVEVVDDNGRALPAGVEGDILITNLAGPEFPFIRYRTGDRGVLSDQTCGCGRGLPLLESISGRANDGLVATDGSWIHGSAINHIIREIPGLQAYRITQDTRHRLHVLLAPTDALTQTVKVRLLEHVRHLLGSDMQIEVQATAEIPPQANGKFRHIICHVQGQDAVSINGSS